MFINLINLATATSILMIVLSIYDIKYKTVPVFLLSMMCVIGGVNQVFYGTDIQSAIVSLGITLALFGLLYALSHFGKEQLGKGDVWLFLGVSLLVGWQVAAVVYILALILIGVFAIILMMTKVGTRKMELPLVPFISMAYMVLVFVGGI